MSVAETPYDVAKSAVESVAKQRNLFIQPDEKRYNAIILSLVKNKAKYGEYYCPCRINRTPENVCPCKKMESDILESGKCHCGLFVSEVS